MTMVQENAVTFPCRDETLLGIAHLPERPRDLGIVFVSGAPQYRVGSHRLFVTLGRELSKSGFPVFRFDLRGIGDSSGPQGSFEDLRDDLMAALAAFKQAAPNVNRVVLLGLCDGASAILLDGIALKGVEGIVLLNPWAPIAEGLSKAMLRSYYVSRLRNWRSWPAALKGLSRRNSPIAPSPESKGRPEQETAIAPEIPPFIPKMLENWLGFSGNSLLVLSQDDVTAAGFDAVVDDLIGWRNLRKPGRVRRVTIKGADHTFSSSRTRDALVKQVTEWLEVTLA